jgi:hypothetical protein
VVFVAILDERLDDFNRKVFVPQIEGSKTSLELPGIVDEVVTLAEIKADDGSAYRAFVTHTVNPYGFPAKDRSGRLDLLEPPHLGALIAKCAGESPRPSRTATTTIPRISRSNRHDPITTSNNWNDFNDAESQQSGFDLIPKGTVVPGAHDHQAGWL